MTNGSGVAVVALAIIAIGLLLVAWTYSDAQENSSHDAFLWAIVVFLAPILGILLYVLLGRDQLAPDYSTVSDDAAAQRTEVISDDAFECGNCRRRFSREKDACPVCGEPVSLDDNS